MKTIFLRLYVLDPEATRALLDLVTGLEGVVAALLDVPRSTLEVVLSSDASALHVREQLATRPPAYPPA